MFTAGIFFTITISSLAMLRAIANLARPRRGRLRRSLSPPVAAADAAQPLYKDVDSWVGELAATEPMPGRVDGTTRRDRIVEYLREAGVPLKPRQLVGLVLGLTSVLALVGFVFVGWLAGTVGLLTGTLVPWAVLSSKRKARRERYIHQLGGAFDLMARVLRSGQTVPEAFRAAADSFGDPLADEFARCVHQIEHGLRPEMALRELSERSGILELRLFVIAMTIQRQTGGNLSEVLDRLAGMVRSRERLRQKLRALTAEGRLQSLTLLVLPGITFAAMFFLNRSYAESLLTQWKLLVATGTCMGVGMLWIRNIMNFEG